MVGGRCGSQEGFKGCLQPGERCGAELLLSPLAPLLVPNRKKEDDLVSASSWPHATGGSLFSLPTRSLPSAWANSGNGGSVWSRRNRPFSPHFRPCPGGIEPLGPPPPTSQLMITVADDPALHKRIMKLCNWEVGDVCI